MYIGIRNALIDLAVEAQIRSARFNARAVNRRCTFGVGDDDTQDIIENSLQGAVASDVALGALVKLIGDGSPTIAESTPSPATVRADAVDEAWRRLVDRARIRDLIMAGSETEQDIWDSVAHIRWLEKCSTSVLLDAYLRFPNNTLRKLAKG